MQTLYPTDIREEEIKLRVAKDFFKDYDTTKIIGNIDFCVAIPNQDSLFKDEIESLVWGEAKQGNTHDIYHSFVQLILTIGKARTFDKNLPPQYLVAFDAAQFAFIPYHIVQDVFYQNDFNWNVTASDHNSNEFKQLYNIVEKTLHENTFIYNYVKDEKELRKFIKQNLILGNRKTQRHKVNKNNFTFVYQRWCDEVKRSINIDWENVKKAGLLDADFFLADLLSKDGNFLLDSLYVLLKHDHYQFDRDIDKTGFISLKEAKFKDEMKSHILFWNKYERPPKREYWSYIVERRDLLVPQDVRERKGSYFTPQKWVELSQQYLADVLGEDWQDNHYIWDCCAGTGNLLVGLTNPRNVWASTLDKADVDIIHERIHNGAKLYDNHIFQFDFLNDDFSKLPQELHEIIQDEDKRHQLVIYINPPYAEAGNAKQSVGTGSNKAKVAITTKTYEKYKKEISKAGQELFAQFFYRIYKEIPHCTLAEFSKLKILQASNFSEFRTHFRAELKKTFLVPAKTFDNVKGAFPIGFFIWDTSTNYTLSTEKADVYNADGDLICTKTIYCPKVSDKNIGQWLTLYKDKDKTRFEIGMMNSGRLDFQNQKYVFIDNYLTTEKTHALVFNFTKKNLHIGSIYYAVRHCIDATWLNDRDQFLYPRKGWESDRDFQLDCIVYTLFHGQNCISANNRANHWIPFTEHQLEITECFSSHFMQDYLRDFKAGKLSTHNESDTAYKQTNLFSTTQSSVLPKEETKELYFSAEAESVMEAGKAVYLYYHKQRNLRGGGSIDASLYDIKRYFKGESNGKMNATSEDKHFNMLMENMRIAMQALAKKIVPKVYEYEFLK